MPLFTPLVRAASILILVLLVGCSSPGATETSGEPTIGADDSGGSVAGTWRGALNIGVDGSGGARPVELVLTRGEGNAISGTLTFTQRVGGSESSLTGTLDGDQFRFQETQGRYVWGTISGETLSGQVAWDGFEGTVHAHLDLISAETVPSRTVRFVDLSDGSQVQLGSGALGMQVETLVEATGLTPQGRVLLQADGLCMALNVNSADADPFQTSLTWWPWHGDGDYVLEVSCSDWSAEGGMWEAGQTLTVHVAGFPAGEETVRDSFIRLYQEYFGLKLAAPVFARYVMAWPDAYDVTRWVSAAYVGDTQYEVDLFDDGTSTTFTRPIGHTTADYAPIGRPAGSYRMLVVFVDYGNTGISESEALQALATASEAWNRLWLEQATAAGVTTPILEIEVTGAFLDRPTLAGQEESAEQIAARTGQDLTRYDFLVEVDLDADLSVATTGGALGFGGTGCWEGGSPMVDIYAVVNSRETLLAGFGTVFDHELSHSLGWSHWWPTGDGSVGGQASSDMKRNPFFPALMFGWTDSDGDGVLEILDPTPYGM
jgi:hypothetical protein